MDEKSLVILDPDGGTRLPAGPGRFVLLKLGVQESAGELTIYESRRPAGAAGGPPLHRHPFDEAFYVLEGEYVFVAGERRVTAQAGSFVFIPGGTSHTFSNDGRSDGRMLTICSPGGIEEMFKAPDAESRAVAERNLGAETVGPPLDVTP